MDTLRFGVRRGDYRAMTWFLYTRRGDAYLSVRELRGRLHFSMHAQDWHLAFEKAHFHEFSGPQSFAERFISTWPRPASPTADVLACRIWTPAMATTVRDPQGSHKVKWIPAAAPGRATVASVVMCARSLDPRDWPGRAEGTRFVGGLGTTAGGSIYVVEHDAPYQSPPPMTVPLPKFQVGTMDELITYGDRLLLINREADASVTFVDVPATLTRNA